MPIVPRIATVPRREAHVMNRKSWNRRWLTAWLLAFFASSPGCVTSRADPVLPDLAASCQKLPCLARRHVYVFLMSGADPLHTGDLSDLRKHVIALGFTQAYHGQFCHGSWIAENMARIRHDDCCA